MSAFHRPRTGSIPAVSADIAAQQTRHFQSDSDFATDAASLDARILARTAAERRADRLLNRAMVAIAGTGALWVVIPAICMALAGGTPA